MGDSVDMLGKVLKDTRIQAGITRKELARKLSITPRHLMSIENSRQKPSYNLLYRLVRELSVPTELIFYPESVHDGDKLQRVSTMLRLLDEKEITMITAALQSLLNVE